MRSLPFSTDEFFAAIRECYNRRAQEPKFARLAFGLLGVAAPSDLIRDTRMTPFNIGRRIELDDFTENEAAPLAKGLGTDEATAQSLLARVLHWTGGHPYLTQRLCGALADALRPPSLDSAAAAPVPPALPILQTVDHLADKLFLSRQARERDDNLIFVRERILRSETDVAGLLLLYRKVHFGQPVPNDETNPLISILRLSGITRNINGYLRVRNRIYRQVYDLRWIQANMPAAELRRQRRAGRHGMLIGFGIAVVPAPGLHLHSADGRALSSVVSGPPDVQGSGQRLPRDPILSRYVREPPSNLAWEARRSHFRAPARSCLKSPIKSTLTLKSAWQRPGVELRLVSDGQPGGRFRSFARPVPAPGRPPGAYRHLTCPRRWPSRSVPCGFCRFIACC